MRNDQKAFYDTLISRISDHDYKIPVTQLQKHWNANFRDTLCKDFPMKSSLQYKPLTHPFVEGEKTRLKKMFINMLLR